MNGKSLKTLLIGFGQRLEIWGIAIFADIRKTDDR